MTKFEEMRLRAFEFQKRTGCLISISSTSIALPKYFRIEFRTKKVIFKAGKSESFGQYGIVRNDVICDSESQWLASIEQHFGQPFPTLLEAQGCKKLTKEKLLSTSQSIIDAIKNATELNVDLNNVNWVDLQMEWYDWLEDEFGGAE